MRRSSSVCRLALSLLVAGAADLAAVERARIQPPPGWPGKIQLPAVAAASPTTAPPLPRPTLTEPFAVGEALYDPGRSADAVMSLLALLGVEIGGSGALARDASFRLAEAEVRGLIEMAQDDARAAAESDGESPFSFRDLHRTVEPFLKGYSAERLAAAYAEAYGAQPEALVPALLLGQPIEPDTPLSRVQIWLLLLDGFAPPAGTPRAGRVAPAAFAAPGGAPAWGTAALFLPSPLSPDPRLSLADFEHLVRTLPLLGFRTPIAVAAAAPAHEGHGGPGQPVTVEASVGRALAPVFGLTGLPLLMPRSTPAPGARFSFSLSPGLASHGGWVGPHGSLALSDASGAARVQYGPRQEGANGQGPLASESGVVTVRVPMRELLASLYELPPLYQNFLMGDVAGHGLLAVAWHAEETMRVVVVNGFDVVLPMGPLGHAERTGFDMAWGRLAKQADGTWTGEFEGLAQAHQQAHGHAFGGNECPPADSKATQKLRVVASPVAGFGPIHTAADYDWTLGRADGGHLRLEFFPATRGRFEKSDRCQTEIWSAETASWFIPFNDAQWTLPQAGYTIGIPAEGELRYLDNTSKNILVGTSIWYVQVEREPPP